MLLAILSLLGCLGLPVHAQDVRISGCSGGGLIDARENTSFFARCYDPSSVQDRIFRWQIKPWRGNQTLEVVCSDRYTSCTPDAEVRVSTSFWYSDLRISKVKRAMFSSSTLTCNVTSSEDQDRFSNASCLIDVIHSADIEDCRLQVHKENWTVTGSCDVIKAYSSAADYGCTLYQRYRKKGNYQVTEHVSNISSLTSFTETSTGLIYYRGQCRFTAPLPSFVGNGTYSLTVTPGPTYKNFNQTVIIVTPSAPQLINCEQDFLVEGGNSPEPPCMCRVTTLGSPSGRLVWRSGDAVLLYGDYGVTQLMFPYEKMDRTHSRKAVKCHVDWIDTWNSTSFSANLAYGPDTAEIFVQSDEDSVTLLCTSLHVHPVSALLTVWGGLCQGQQGRTCTLTTLLHEHNEKNVTCTLTNQKVPGKQATVTWTLKLDDGRSVQDNSMSCSLSEGLGIGVGVTLAVVLVVVAVLSVLLWRRRLQPAGAVVETCSACFTRCSSTYASPSKRQQQEEADSHNYTDLSHYEAVSPPRQQVDTNRGTASFNDDNNHVYANTAANIEM